MDKKESEDIKEELENLKKSIRKLEKRIGLEEKQDKKEPVSKKEGRKYVRTLVILVIILLVIDAVSLIAYYKPDIGSLFKLGDGNKAGTNSNGSAVNGNCKDGTKNGECSTNKPYLCYSGDLVLNAPACGCPSGYKIDFRSCVKI